MTGRRIGWRIGAGVVLALLAAGCAKAEAIKIASARSSSNAPLLIAKEKGYFDGEAVIDRRYVIPLPPHRISLYSLSLRAERSNLRQAATQCRRGDCFVALARSSQ